MTHNSKNGKGKTALDSLHLTETLSEINSRLEEIKFQYLPGVSSLRFQDKEEFKKYYKIEQGKLKSKPWETGNGIAKLIEIINKGITIKPGINYESNKKDKISCFDWVFIDYDSWDKKENRPIDGVATLEELQSLKTIKKYCAFYQKSFSYRDIAPNSHWKFIFDRSIDNVEDFEILAQYLRLILTSELGNRNGFDPAIDGNPAQVCFTGKFPCEFINRIPGLDSEFPLLPVDKFLKEAKELGIEPTKTEVKKEVVKSLAPKPENSTVEFKGESPLEYIQRVIVEDKLQGDWSVLFCLHPHNWKVSSRTLADNAIGQLDGANPFSSTDSSGESFTITKFDNNLPPQFFSRAATPTGIKDNDSDKNGGDIITYWYRCGRKEGKYRHGGIKANFKNVVNDICNHFEVEPFKFKSTKSNSDDDDDRSKRQKLYDKIIKLFDGAIKFNEMTLQPELNGVEIDFDTITAELDIKYRISAGREMLQEILLYIAKENSYHPVRDYLEEVAEKYSNYQPELISNLSSKYFGTTDEIYNIYIRKTLISAVARIFEPGCQMKTMLTLSGKQDAGKSTWIRNLFSPRFFNDGIKITDFGDKDDKLIINSYWTHEIDEIDKITRKTDRANLKSLISSPSDNFRPPYGRKVSSHPRKSIFIATTNETSILNDPTGEVRFWCIPVEKKIDFKLVEQERDILWAMAFHAYQKREQWWLDEKESEKRKESNEQFESTDEIEYQVLWYANAKEHVLIYDVLLALDMKPEDKALQLRIADIFKRNGWTKNQMRVNKIKAKYWVNPNFSSNDNLNTISEEDKSKVQNF